MSKTYIIAEVGPNHNGSLKMALKYVDELSNIGVDAIKFQLADPKKLFSKNSKFAKYQIKNSKYKNPKEMIKKTQLSKSDHLHIYNYCNKKNIQYLCTAFDLESLKFLNKNFNLSFFKIASGEIFSLDMLDYISKFKKKIILSSGMASFDEINQCIKILNKNFKKQITILHCISSYPVKIENVNLNVMSKLHKKFNYPVGFSDHTKDILSSIVAVSMGATIIEKHVTFSRGLEGPDHKASSTISEFKKLVKEIRKIDLIKGSDKNIISDEENEIANVSRKSIVANKTLYEKHIIKNSDITFKRPGTGILPIFKNKIIGKKVKNKILKDSVINLKDVHK